MVPALLLYLLVQIRLIISVSAKWIFWIKMLLRQLILWKIKPVYFLGLSHFERLYLKLVILIICVLRIVILLLCNYTWAIDWIINVNIVVITFMKFIIYFVKSVQMSFTYDWLSRAIGLLYIGFIWALDYIVYYCLNWLEFPLFSFWLF